MIDLYPVDRSCADRILPLGAASIQVAWTKQGLGCVCVCVLTNEDQQVNETTEIKQGLGCV